MAVAQGPRTGYNPTFIRNRNGKRVLSSDRVAQHTISSTDADNMTASKRNKLTLDL